MPVCGLEKFACFGASLCICVGIGVQENFVANWFGSEVVVLGSSPI